MAKPFSALPGIMRDYSIRVEKGVGRVTREVATVVDARVVDGTPVDTGVARSNWIASLNVPVEYTIPAYAPGLRLGLAETANAAGAKAQAALVISAFREGRHRAIVIANNVDYIGQLNDGTSTQAPRNFVEKAVQSGVETVKRSKVLTRR